MTTTDANSGDLLRILGDLDRVLVGVLDPVLADHDVGREHWQVLRLLADGRGRSMGALATELGLSGATATRVVDHLASTTLVYRRSDPLDRRRVLVHLSDTGQATLERVNAAMQHHTSSAFEGLAHAEQERFAEVLERLVTCVRR